MKILGFPWTIRTRLSLLYAAAFFIACVALIVVIYFSLGQVLDRQFIVRLRDLGAPGELPAPEVMSQLDRVQVLVRQGRLNTLDTMLVASLILVGIMTLSALSANPAGGLVLGLAYVFGMVFPLFVMALVWDKAKLNERRFLRARLVRIRVSGRVLVTNTVNLIVAVGFTVMGIAIIALANQKDMSRGSAAQTWISTRLTSAFLRIQNWASPVPEVVQALLLFLVVGGLAVVLRRMVLARRGGFVLCWRFSTLPDGQGWKFGQGRYEDRGLVLYRSFSPFPWPARILTRRLATLGDRRDPVGSEIGFIPDGWVVQECQDAAGPMELALSEETLTGLRSWAESEPPQTRIRRA